MSCNVVTSRQPRYHNEAEQEPIRGKMTGVEFAVSTFISERRDRGLSVGIGQDMR